MQKNITISTEASYITKNTFSDKTKYVWLVCHGYGQLAKYFVRRFDILDEKVHYIVAPEGLSKFYLDANYGKVGASWLTKENKEIYLQNQLSYLEKVYFEELKNIDLEGVELVLLGFSQGVATICRWAVNLKIPFKKLILWAGAFPTEISKNDLEFVDDNAQIFLLIGNEDEYLNYFRIEDQVKLISDLCLPPKLITFTGGHEVKREVLQEVVQSF